MKKIGIIIILLVIISGFVFSLIIALKPNFVAAVSKGGADVVVPEQVVEIAPGIFSLGSSFDKDGRKVDGYLVYHHREGHNKGGDTGNGTGSSCYSFIASGAKWKTIESWIVNMNNSEGLTEDFIFNNLMGNIQKWETEAAVNILGDGNTTSNFLSADTSSPDGLNEVYFADVSDSGAIAVTIVWGIFRGPPSQRVLVEWDMVFDEVDFNWSSTGEIDKMDFENIATHEIGHATGMGHPDNSCTEETMFAFADEGETKKRDLHTGDITGIQKLY